MSRNTKILFYLLMSAISVVFVGPFLILLSTAVKPISQPIFSFPPQLVPLPPVLDWFIEAWTQISFPRYLWNSVLLELLTVPAYLVISALAAYPLARMRFRGRQVVFGLIVSTMFLPGEVMLVPRFLIVSQLGMVDTFAGVVLPGLMSAFGVFLLRQAFEQLPRELFEAARVDGCNQWQTFWRVALPQVAPTMATLAIFAFINVWNNFIWPLVVLKTDSNYPLALGLAYLAGIFGDDQRSLAAGTVMALAPVLVFFIAMQRHFIEGMKGSVKG
ncbi:MULTISPECIES: carbohydrate ABC transporter permease [Amycolatopsis]|uniref:Sugar ABC transporter permease n=2 Tax=Amycolatopsis TaxID=1813 RepID=A0A076MYH4_AMYME|nr:carbohydrate ABC transporter permease [Amycolatopsis methanolica]AIJ26224.1 sugar ABC transporter permease [Amycolatopsis methanolica 239]